MASDGRFHVEAYISGTPYKERRFDLFEEAAAYQADLHSVGHYCAPIIDREEPGVAERQGTRINHALACPGSHPWATWPYECSCGQAVAS
jgi:hypothetical protein